MLALAAAIFSTLHQSSLGSLFLLMGDKLDRLWWSPILPIHFFLSALAGGTALVVLTDILIAKSYGRVLPISQLAAVAKVSFWALLIYELGQLGDVIGRGQTSAAFSSGAGHLFLAEILFGGILPLLLLSSDRLRRQPTLLASGTFLLVAGVAFNRMNVVMFAMNSKGPMPQIAPAHYWPSILEWSIFLGVCAATIFIFGYAARLLSVLPKEAAAGD